MTTNITNDTRDLYFGYSSVFNTGIDTRLTGTALVKQDLMNHFQTRLGERVGRPNFGSIIHDLLFDVSDTRTEQLVRDDIERIIRTDPRVRLLDLDVTVDHDTYAITANIKLSYVEYDMAEWFDVTFEINQG